MSRFKKGIIVSNILDPLSKDPKDLKVVYQRLFAEKRYEAIETRVLKDESLIEYYNEIKKPNVSLEAYVTGDLSRMGVSLSSVNEESRHKAIEYTKEMDMEVLSQKGLSTVPYLEVDGQMMDFIQANKWINEQ